MTVKIAGKAPDERVQQILRDPRTYFAMARKRARAAILAERDDARVSYRRRRRRTS